MKFYKNYTKNSYKSLKLWKNYDIILFPSKEPKRVLAWELIYVSKKIS